MFGTGRTLSQMNELPTRKGLTRRTRAAVATLLRTQDLATDLESVWQRHLPRCLHNDYNDGWDGPKQYGTGDWSGACAFRRPASTPAGLDSKKFKTTNDTRIVALHEARAHYTCSYPNDPTTMGKIQQQAVEFEARCQRHLQVGMWAVWSCSVP